MCIPGFIECAYPALSKVVVEVVVSEGGEVSTLFGKRCRVMSVVESSQRVERGTVALNRVLK